MLKVAITGNIASGKSTVENFLKEKGYNVLDTDVVAHELLKTQEVKGELSKIFNKNDIFENEEISRKKLGPIIFTNDDLRKKLESILHPKIKEEIGIFFQELKEKNEKVAFVSIPLLFEAKFENLFDKIILIYTNDKIRLKRLMERNNLSLEHAKNRLNIQISQDKKISLVDYVIYNDKTLNDLRKNVEEVLILL